MLKGKTHEHKLKDIFFFHFTINEMFSIVYLLIESSYYLNRLDIIY